MPSSPQPSVVAAVDPDDPDRAMDALAFGAVLAAATGAQLQSVTVAAPESVRDDETVLRRTLLDAHVLRSTSPARALHELCDRERPAVVVIAVGRAARPDGSTLGTMADALLHGGASPVALVPHGYAYTSRALLEIGVGDGGTPESAEALSRGAELAATAGARLTVISAPEPPDGDPVEVLVAASLELDVLVVGSASFGPLRALRLGAVTRRLIARAACPLIVVPLLPDAGHEVALEGGMDATLAVARRA